VLGQPQNGAWPIQLVSCLGPVKWMGMRLQVNLSYILQLGMSFAYTTRKTQSQLKSAVIPGNESSLAKFNSGRGWSIWSVSHTLKVRITFVL